MTNEELENEKKKIDHELMRKKKIKDQEINEWVGAFIFSFLFLLGLLILITIIL